MLVQRTYHFHEDQHWSNNSLWKNTSSQIVNWYGSVECFSVSSSALGSVEKGKYEYQWYPMSHEGGRVSGINSALKLVAKEHGIWANQPLSIGWHWSWKNSTHRLNSAIAPCTPFDPIGLSQTKIDQRALECDCFSSYQDHFILTELSAAHLHCMSNAPFNAVFEALCRKVPLILALEVPCPKWPPVDLVNSRSLYANGIDNNDWLFVHGLKLFPSSCSGDVFVG